MKQTVEEVLLVCPTHGISLAVVDIGPWAFCAECFTEAMTKIGCPPLGVKHVESEFDPHQTVVYNCTFCGYGKTTASEACGRCGRQ